MDLRKLRRSLVVLAAAFATAFTAAAPANGSATGDVDAEVPILTGVSFSTSTASPGTLVKINITATDAQSTVHAQARLKNIDVPSWENTSGLLLPFNHTGEPLSLPLEVTDGHQNGRWALTEIYLVDSLGNWAYYYRDGTVRLKQGTTGPSSNPVDFAGKLLTISGAASPQPQLKSLTLPTTLVRGTTMNLAFEAYPGPAPAMITLDASGPHTTAVGTFEARVTSPTTAALTVPAGTPSFDGWHVDRVKVTDATGRWSRYFDAGPAFECSGVCLGREPFAFPTGQFSVVGTPAKVDWAYPFSLDRAGGVDVQAPLDGGRTITSYRVVINPGGRVVTVPATFGGPQRIPISGLQNNIVYAVDVSAVNSLGIGPAKRVTVIPRSQDRLSSPFDVNGDHHGDIFGAVGNAGYLWRGAGQGKVKPPIAAAIGWSSTRMTLPSWTYPEVVDGSTTSMWSVRYDGRLYRYSWAPNLSLSGSYLASGMEKYRLVIAPGDINNDVHRTEDLLGVTDAGVLELIPGNANGNPFLAPIKVSAGWGGFRQVFGIGDQNGDRQGDLVGVYQDGSMWLYYGNGKGAFPTRRQIGTGWAGFRTVFAASDMTGDRKTDIVSVTTTGAMYVYRGNGKGSFGNRSLVGTGWASAK